MLNLKGIWIPIEILMDRNISDKEKIIFAIIMYLTKVKYPSTRKLKYPIKQKFKDNKYNKKINNKNIDSDSRDYSNFDFRKLFANAKNFIDL